MTEHTNSLPDRFVITIGRTFGSGGRSLAQALAEHFGIDFYDKELLQQAAARAGLSCDQFEQNDERMPRFLSGVFAFNMGFSSLAWYNNGSSISGDSLYQAQCDFIRDIASKKPCVIVGRTADYVLRDLPNVVNIFVHASDDDCVRRIMSRTPGLDSKQALNLAHKTNKLRSNFYNFYSDKEWGHSRSYHLTVDSASMPMAELVGFVADFVVRHLNNNSNSNHQNG